MPQTSTDRRIFVQLFALTDVGLRREHNEDAHLIADLTSGGEIADAELPRRELGARGMLFMVADGMGGPTAGEVASRIAVEVVHEELRARWVRGASTEPAAFVAALTEAARQANARINQRALQHAEYKGMGTTATIAGLLRDRLYVLQVGDSRAYVVRNGRAHQITKDQSFTQHLVEAGKITPAEAEQSGLRHIILQAMGPEPGVAIDFTQQKLRRGDSLLLCTDGLSGVVTNEEIAEILTADADLVTASRRLIDCANQNGGPDNITALVARFDGPGLDVALPGHDVGQDVSRLLPVAAPAVDASPTAAAALSRSHRSRHVGRNLALIILAALILVGIISTLQVSS